MQPVDPNSSPLPDLPLAVRLIHCPSNQFASARLEWLNGKLAKSKMGKAWWSGLGVSKSMRADESDHHWDWAAELGKQRNSPFAKSVCIRSVDGDIQGAMIYQTNGLSVLTRDAGAILIERLATAPRNRPWLVAHPLYRHIGITLVRWAAFHGYRLGFGGRIVLATLPSPRTERFYKSLGFRGTDAEEDDMVIYELEPGLAQSLLRNPLEHR